MLAFYVTENVSCGCNEWRSFVRCVCDIRHVRRAALGFLTNRCRHVICDLVVCVVDMEYTCALFACAGGCSVSGC